MSFQRATSNTVIPPLPPATTTNPSNEQSRLYQQQQPHAQPHPVQQYPAQPRQPHLSLQTTSSPPLPVPAAPVTSRNSLPTLPFVPNENLPPPFSKGSFVREILAFLRAHVRFHDIYRDYTRECYNLYRERFHDRVQTLLGKRRVSEFIHGRDVNKSGITNTNVAGNENDGNNEGDANKTKECLVVAGGDTAGGIKGGTGVRNENAVLRDEPKLPYARWKWNAEKRMQEMMQKCKEKKSEGKGMNYYSGRIVVCMKGFAERLALVLNMAEDVERADREKGIEHRIKKGNVKDRGNAKDGGHGTGGGHSRDSGSARDGEDGWMIAIDNKERKGIRYLVLTTEVDYEEYEKMRSSSSVEIRRTSFWTKVQVNKRDWEENGGVMVMSFTRFMQFCARNQSARKALCNPGPDVVILDGAEKLRSFTPSMRRLLRRIGKATRWAITGVPFRGCMREWWAIADWISPGHMGCVQEFIDVIEKNVLEGASGIGKKHTGEDAAKYFESKINELTYLDELPMGIQGVEVVVNMTPLQSKIYAEAAQVLRKFCKAGLVSTYVAVWVLQRATLHPEALFEVCDYFANAESFEPHPPPSLPTSSADQKHPGSATSQQQPPDWSHFPTSSSHHRKKKPPETPPEARSNEHITDPTGSTEFSPNGNPLDAMRDPLREVLELARRHKDLIARQTGDSLQRLNYGSKLEAIYRLFNFCISQGENLVVLSPSIHEQNIIYRYFSDVFPEEQRVMLALTPEEAEACNSFVPGKSRLVITSYSSLAFTSSKSSSWRIQLDNVSRVVITAVSWGISLQHVEAEIVSRFRCSPSNRDERRPVKVYRLSAYGTAEEDLGRLIVGLGDGLCRNKSGRGWGVVEQAIGLHLLKPPRPAPNRSKRKMEDIDVMAIPFDAALRDLEQAKHPCVREKEGLLVTSTRKWYASENEYVVKPSATQIQELPDYNRLVAVRMESAFAQAYVRANQNPVSHQTDHSFLFGINGGNGVDAGQGTKICPRFTDGFMTYVEYFEVPQELSRAENTRRPENQASNCTEDKSSYGVIAVENGLPKAREQGIESPHRVRELPVYSELPGDGRQPMSTSMDGPSHKFLRRA